MMRKKIPDLLRYLAMVPLLALGGCSTSNFWLFNPKGLVAAAELHYMILDVAIMLIVIIPTTLLIIWFLWRYRASTGKGTYAPKWSHSNTLEIIVWGVPLVIVALLGYYSYEGVEAVNPYGPLVISKDPKYANAKPLEVDVITTNWQWLFVYPKQNIAVSNELVVPVHTRVNFRLTSTSVTNSFFIPQVVGQIYAMPGMRTKQSMVVQHKGDYHGFSAALSGGGFTWMHFKLKAVSEQDFQAWVSKASQNTTAQLTYADFAKFAKPTINIGDKVQYFKDVQPDLLAQVIKNVRNGTLRYKTPLFLTENMRSSEFKKHAN